MDRINVVAACDGNFVQHLGVMLSSLLRTNPDEPIRFFVLTTADEPALQGVREVAARHRCVVEPIAFDPRPFTSLPSVRHLSHATYFRLAIPEALPPEITRVIYLDCDVIVTKPIRDLWAADIGEAVVGAVPEVSSSYDLGKLKLPAASPYFNAGMLLIDVQKWRADNISDVALDVLRNQFERTSWADQCALNIALHGKWKPLHHRWNLITQMLGTLYGSELTLNADAERLLAEAAVIHYSTHTKPWHYANQHPKKHLYWDEIKHTPWRRSRPSGMAGYYAKKLLGEDSPLTALCNRLLGRQQT